jgi:luciferase family oxidoreductase group 1
MTYFKLSILDQTPIAASSGAISAVSETIELARLGEQLGYHRFWVAEHHGSATFAGSAPEVLIAGLAMATQCIRVGSGGVLLPHYSPFKVAETFSVLAAMAPDRIDLGVGRASGSDALTSLALQRNRNAAATRGDFPAQLGELIAYFDPERRFPAGHPFENLRDHLPHGGKPPRLWLLGTSTDSARLAGEAGLPYAIADFINPQGAALAKKYRDSFRPSAMLETPYLIVATSAICAQESQRASDLRYPFIMVMALMFRGQIIAVPSVEEAKRWAQNNPADAHAIMRMTYGDPHEVRDGLCRIANDYGADEVMIANIVPEFEARLQSYRLIADAFGLEPTQFCSRQGVSA